MKNNWIVIGVLMAVHCLISSVRNGLCGFLWTGFFTTCFITSLY